jgi:eukaryotic-like serine/threonine-protein kinase
MRPSLARHPQGWGPMSFAKPLLSPSPAPGTEGNLDRGMSSAAVATGVPAAGTIIAEKYRVVSVLGSGGMGCVVKADHLLLKKPVAVKFLQSDTSSSARQRLFREARATQALSSENVVRVFDIGVHGESPYIVMELLEGTDLAARVDDEGPLPVAEAVDCLLEACVAVAEAHANGIVHRDIKPANLFFARTQTQQLVKVLDFGISKVPEATGGGDCEKTAEDVVLGTPYYMSPEQLRNPAKIDGRTDVWALAVTLFYLLAGEHPFRGDGPREVTAAIFTDPPRDLRELRPELPAALCRVIAEALAKRAEERTPSVSALVQGLLPFSTKRGRLAAERVAAIGGPLPPLTTTMRTARIVPMTTTDAGLASTLPPTADANPPKRHRGEVDAAQSAEPDVTGPDTHSSVHVDAPRVSRTRLAAIAGVTVAGLAGMVWFAGDRGAGAESQPPASAASVVIAPEPSVAVHDAEGARPADTTAPPEPPATKAEPPVATAPAAAASPARPPSVARVPAPGPRTSAAAAPASAPAAASAAPSAAPSVAPAAKRPRTDIDGVPIVD